MLQRLLCKLAGLPVAPTLKRDISSWVEQPLKHCRVLLVSEVEDSPLLISQTLQALGAEVVSIDSSNAQQSQQGTASTPKAAKSTGGAGVRQGGSRGGGGATSVQPPIEAAVVSFLGQPTNLESVNRAFERLQSIVRRLSKNGRILLFLRDDCEEQLAGHMAMAAFARSLSKELGPKGSTINTIIVNNYAEATQNRSSLVSPLLPVLVFFLSHKSTYITGQVLRFSPSTSPGPEKKLASLHSGRVVLVTGAARGIGRAIANAFLREGATVVLVDRDPVVTKPAVANTTEVGTFFGIVADIASSGGRAELLTQLQAKGITTLDTVVHNAGITRDKTLANMTGDQWKAVMNVNMLAIAELNKVLPLSAKNSSMAFISSQSGLGGNFGQTNYAATKGALMGWTRELSRKVRHGENQSAGVAASIPCQVICIAPGFIETQMTAQMPTVMRVIGGRSSALLQGGKPEDVANAVCFFTSPLAAGFSGECVRVCGGNFVGADSAYLYSSKL